MDQQPADWNSFEIPVGLDLFSLIDTGHTQFEKKLADVFPPQGDSFPTTTVRPEVNNNRSEVESSPASDTLNTPSPRSSPPPWPNYTKPASPPTDTTPSPNCTMLTDPNENLACTSTVIYPNTSTVFNHNTNPVHTSEGTYQGPTPFPTNQEMYPDTATMTYLTTLRQGKITTTTSTAPTIQVTYSNAATMPYLNIPRQAKITTTASSVEKEHSYTMTSYTVTNEKYIPIPVAKFTTLPNSLSTLPSNIATHTSKPANLSALSSRDNPQLSKASTLSEETCITLNLPDVNYTGSMEDSDPPIIIIDPENETQKSLDLGTILKKCEIGDYPMRMINYNESITVGPNFEKTDEMNTQIEEDGHKGSLQHLITQDALKTTAMSRGRGRPRKTVQGPIALKVDRRKAKSMDSKDVEEQRKQRKADLNREAHIRYRINKKRKQQEVVMDEQHEVAKKKKLKAKESEMEKKIEKSRNWFKMRGIEVKSPYILR